MKRRHAAKEDGGSIRVHIFFNPFLPRGQYSSISQRPLNFIILRWSFIKRSTPIHIKLTKDFQRYAICGEGYVNLRKKYLQNFHGESIHPPNVSIKDEIVNIFPILSMLIDGLRHDYTVQNAMHFWIIRIWLYQKRGPVELHCSIIVLQHTWSKVFLVSWKQSKPKAIGPPKRYQFSITRNDSSLKILHSPWFGLFISLITKIRPNNWTARRRLWTDWKTHCLNILNLQDKIKEF